MKKLVHGRLTKKFCRKTFQNTVQCKKSLNYYYFKSNLIIFETYITSKNYYIINILFLSCVFDRRYLKKKKIFVLTWMNNLRSKL